MVSTGIPLPPEDHRPARRLVPRVSAIDLRYSDQFDDRIDQLSQLLDDELDHQDDMLEQLPCPGQPEQRARRAPFIRGHAPIHPSEHHHWYQDIAPGAHPRGLRPGTKLPGSRAPRPRTSTSSSDTTRGVDRFCLRSPTGGFPNTFT